MYKDEDGFLFKDYFWVDQVYSSFKLHADPLSFPAVHEWFKLDGQQR